MKSREEKFYIVKVTHPKDMHEKEHDIVVKRGDCDKFKHFYFLLNLLNINQTQKRKEL